jgi:DNA-binding HxlR family transcriptional regulator
MTTIEDSTEQRCQIVRTLGIIGERWSLLIIRNALRGQTKFSEFRDSLGAPSDILTARLATLVDAGVMEKRAYREPGCRERSSYHLTESGRGLKLIIGAMVQWGDEFNPSPYGPSSVLTDTSSAKRLDLAFVAPGGESVDLDAVRIAPGPGAITVW